MLTGAVVVHYRSDQTLRATVRDVLAALPGRPVIVVDNSSTAEPDPDPDLVVLRPGANLGYAAAVNLGLRELRARGHDGIGVLVCTHEVRLEPEDLRRLEITLEDDPTAGVVAPALVLERRADGAPGPPWSFGGGLSRIRWRPAHFRSAVPDSRVAWVDGACYLIRTEAWRTVGGVPEEFFLYMEDVALGVLIRRAGYTIRVRADVQVEQRTTGPSRATAIRNWMLFLDHYASRRHYVAGLADVLAHAAYHLVTGGAAGRARCLEGLRAIADSRRLRSGTDHDRAALVRGA